MSSGIPANRRRALGPIPEVAYKTFPADISQDSLFNLEIKPLVLLVNKNQSSYWLQLRVAAYSIQQSGRDFVEPEDVPEIIREGGGSLAINGPIVYEHCGDPFEYYQTALNAMVRVAIPRRFEDRSFLPGTIKLAPKPKERFSFHRASQ